jgi:hypothetical protein
MIKDACLIGNSIINSGKECDTSMLATAQFIAVPPDLSFSLADIEDDIVGWITPLLHAPIGQRVYPFFGLKAPINNITNNAGSDTIVTLDDGTPVFLRYALYTKTFETIAGGLCYAKALQGLNKSGYNIIEIDQIGQMLVGRNNDGTFRGLITNFMYAPAPKQADLKTNPYLNQFQISYSPVELVQNGKIFSGASPLLQLMGLIDAEIISAGAASTTEILVTVQTECAKKNIAAKFTGVIDPDNFVVTKESDGTVVALTAVTLTGTTLSLEGAFVSGQKYRVSGASPSVWYANSVEGYDAENFSLEVTIP